MLSFIQNNPITKCYAETEIDAEYTARETMTKNKTNKYQKANRQAGDKPINKHHTEQVTKTDRTNILTVHNAFT